MKTALVTGAAGFVGRHLVPRLKAEGYDVRAIDPKPLGDMDPVRGHIAYRWQDYRDEKYDLIVHLAANIVSVDKRMAGALEMYQDIKQDYEMAECVLRTRPACFIYPSSCAVDSDEDPYGWVKQTGERFCQSLHRQGIRTVIIRPFSGYGPDQSLEYPFPSILKRALEHQDPLELWGSGHQVRDFVWIDDFVDAFIWAIDKAYSGMPVEVGTGVGTPFWKLAEMIAKEVGYKPGILGLQSKPESMTVRIARKAFNSHMVSLEEGIKRSVAAQCSAAIPKACLATKSQ